MVRAAPRARRTAAHRDAVYGEIPSTDDEKGLKQFSAVMKLEPFQRGMKELAPTVWLTALRKVQNPNRAERCTSMPSVWENLCWLSN